MALFKILKGQQARLPNTSKQGYAYYTTDKGKFYIFNSKTQRRTLNPDIKITIGNQTKTSTTLSPEVAFDLASIGAAAAGHNHDNRYLKLSGGTMTGTITLLGSQCADNYSGALNANNSNIYGVNSIYTADLADTSAEGIHFYRTSTTVDSLWIKNGVIYFTPNRTLGKTGTDYTVIHSGNYTDYTVKKDGAGASGNWNINAATATKLQTARNINLGNDLQGGVSFNGTSDVTINASSYHCNVDSGNTSNYPWHRIARVDNMSGQYIDRVAILDLHRKYNGGGYGRIKVSLRTSSTNSAVNISAVWLYRYGFAVDQIAIVQNGNTGSQVWADIYLRCGAYARTTVYQVEGDRLWTLVSSSERQNTTTTDKKGSTEVYTAPGGARAGSKTVYGVDGAITLYSMLPYGFTTCSTNPTWGNTIGTTITSWNDSTGGSIDFRRDNPSSGKMSVKVDGRFYGNEGVNPASLMTNANGYWGIGDPDGNSSNWIRTTTNGLIPVQSGGQGNGHSALGTSSWYFKEAFIDNINGTNLYLRGQTGNRLIWLNSSKMLDTTGHYASGSKVAINSTSEPGYNFYVNGTSYFVNNVGIAGYNANYKLYTNGKSLFNGDIYLTNKGALIIYGDTVGNDVNTLISKTVGVLSYGDTGPKIDFGTSATGNQRGAIIFTDHDAAGAGVSWHFVSNQADWNVNSKRFVAKTSITIGQNLPNTNYNLYVNGSTYLNGILNVASTLQPTSTNTQTLGTSSLRWAKVYIGTADTYGSTTKGVYWNAGVPTAMTYELKSTVNNGTATRIAYYSGTNAVSSGSIVTNGSFLHNVSSLYVTKNDWVFDLGHNYTNQDAYLSADAGGIRIAFNTTNEGQTMTSIRPDSIYIGKKDSDGDFHDTITTDNASGSITMTGQLKVGDKVKLWTDSEGGNIDLIDNSSTRHYQIDAFNGNLRLYSQLYQNDSGLLRITLLDTNGNTTLNNIYTSTIYASNWFRSQGDSGWYNQNYDGGWYMSDSTWIRSFHNKSLYTGTGTIRSEREIQSTSIGGVCQFRAIGGAYGAMLRNDGADTWILLTNAWDQYGSWNGLRPFRINNGSGGVYIQTSLIYQHFTPVGNLYVGWNEGSSPALTASYGGTTASGSGNVITEARMKAAIANKHGSDRRVKQNIRDLSIQTIKKIYMNFKPVRYEFKQGALADKYAPGERFGYIAQDMESSFLKYGVNPGQLVYHQHNIDKTSKLYSYLGECNLYTIDYENLHALHTLMIQQHDSQIEQLKKQNKKLQQQIQLLNAKLDTLVVSHL